MTTTSKVAEKLGVTPKTILQRAHKLGIGKKFMDTKTSPFVFTAKEIEKLGSLGVKK